MNFFCYRDVWQMYLDKGEFELAKDYCRVSLVLLLILLSPDKKRILQKCSCFIEFIKRVGEKR